MQNEIFGTFVPKCYFWAERLFDDARQIRKHQPNVQLRLTG